MGIGERKAGLGETTFETTQSKSTPTSVRFGILFLRRFNYF